MIQVFLDVIRTTQLELLLSRHLLRGGRAGTGTVRGRAAQVRGGVGCRSPGDPPIAASRPAGRLSERLSGVGRAAPPTYHRGAAGAVPSR